MHTTPELIELAKQRLAMKHGLPLPMTDYRLSKLMGLSTQNLTSWRTGRTRIGTQFARKFAEACDLSAEYVYACVQRERADTADEISLLERIAQAFQGKAAAVAMMNVGAALLAAGMIYASPENAGLFASFSFAPSIHYANLAALLIAAGAAAVLWSRRAKSVTDDTPGPIHPQRMNGLTKGFTIFPVMALCTGCTALRTPEEITWQALHAIDSAQTYRIAQHPECFHEANPITGALIGEHPSRSSVIAWSIGMAGLHAGVTEILLRTEHPKLARAWQYVTIGTTSAAVGNNYSIGIRIGAHNQQDGADCIYHSPPAYAPDARPIR